MAISFYNFKELHNETFKTNLLKVYDEIVTQNSYIEGKYNTLFEQEFAKQQGSRHCLLTANGTDALEIALKVHNVGPNDKVGIPALTFFATAECVLNVGADVVFIDVDPATGLMCPKSLQKTIEQHKLKAIIPVHIYGQPAPISLYQKMCDEAHIKIIEDGAQAMGTFLDNASPIGDTPNLLTYSFYPTKNLGALGDAGAILTKDESLAKKIISLRNHGRGDHGYVTIGRNSRCDHFQAAALYLKMHTAEEQNKKRKALAAEYYTALKSLPIKLLPEKMLKTSSWHLFPIFVKNSQEKMALHEFLKKKEIASSTTYYQMSLTLEPTLKQFAGDCPNAITFAEQSFCLPMHPFLTSQDILEIANALKTFYS